MKVNTSEPDTHRARATWVGVLCALAFGGGAAAVYAAADDEPSTSTPVVAEMRALDHDQDPLVTQYGRPEDAPTKGRTTRPQATASPIEDPPRSGRVEINAIDYAFEGLPEQIAPGAKLALHNSSATELHEIVAFRLPDGEKRSAVELSKLPEAELETVFAGEPEMVLIARPGEDAFNALRDGVIEERGRYVLFCAIPQGADPDEYLQASEGSDGPPEVDGGPPHFTLGMVGEVTVK